MKMILKMLWTAAKFRSRRMSWTTSRTLKDAFEPPYRGKPLESFTFEEDGIKGLLGHDSLSFVMEADVEISEAVADAVILCDNERFLKRDANLVNNMERINQEIVAPFYDLLCAGEEVKRSRIGAKTVDAGDIIQTMEGWTAIGVGRSHLPTLSRLPFERRKNFRKKGRETQRGLEAVDQAISELSVTCSPRDAGKALYMLSAPSKEMNVALVRELGGIMREMAEDAVIRSGDYPRAGGDVSVTLIFSKLSSVPRLKEFYRKTSSSTSTLKQRQLEAEERLREMEEAAEGVPSLLSGDGAR